MSLFGKKQPEVPQTFIVNEAAEAAGVDHNNVLDYLLQLKTEEYDKLLKLAGIYRAANKEAGELIPQYDPDLADTAEPVQIAVRVENSSASDEDEDAALYKLMDDAFLEDEPKATRSNRNAKSN